MRKILLLSLLCISAALMASDICIDGIWYKFHGNEAEVTYKGTGEMDFNNYLDRYTDSLIVPESVTYESKTYTVTAIDSGAARFCQNLTYLELPNTIKRVEVDAFYFTGLKEVNIPDNVEVLENYSFGDIGFEKLTIGKGLKEFPLNALLGSAPLALIEVSPCNPYFTSGDHCNAIINRKTKELVLGCKNSVVPTYVTKIGYNAFYWCTNLTKIELPCVDTIDFGAFSDCGALKEVVLGKKVKWIGSGAFEMCISLNKIYCYATTPPTIEDGEYGLGDSESVIPAKIYVPRGSKGTYETTTGWSNYDCFEEFDVPADPTPEQMPEVECPESGIEEFFSSNSTSPSNKVMIDGQLLIQINNQLYNAQGYIIQTNY